MVAEESSFGELTFEQRPEGEEKANLVVMWEEREGRVFQVEETAGTKALRQSKEARMAWAQ